MSDNFLIYRTEDEAIEVEVRFDQEAETVWLTTNQMASLFGRDEKTISEDRQHTGSSLPGSMLSNTMRTRYYWIS